jgi:hypothetical protein
MWQATHEAPLPPSRWKWCFRVAKRSGWWHDEQTSSRPTLTFWSWASWQSEQVTPFAYIRLWRKEPQLYTSSRICPSA